MSVTEDTDQIVIVDGPAAGVASREVVDLADTGVAAEPVDELAALKAELAEKNRLLEETQGKLHAADSERAASRSKLTEQIAARFAADESAVNASLTVATQSLASVKADFIKANEEGRYAEAADLAEKMADLKLDLRQANFQKQQVEKAKAEAEKQALRAADPADPVAARKQQIRDNVTPASARWFDAHPDVLDKMATDERFYARVAAADYEAYAAGNDRDTPQYFAYIEKALALSGNSDPAAQPARKTTPNPGATASAARNTRPTAALQNPGARTIHIDDVVRQLNANDRMNARTSFPNDPEDVAAKNYARGLIKTRQREPDFRPDIKI